MAKRQSRPSEPRERPRHYETKYRADDQFQMLQNIYRMWRDFPSLRFGQFLHNALRKEDNVNHRVADFHTVLFYAEDNRIEMECWKYWVEHSGRATKKQKEKYDDAAAS